MECDADLLVEEAAKAVDAVMEYVGSQAIEIVAVATAAFWHSVMGMSADGSAATPVYGWGDTRAAATAHVLRDEVDEAELHRETGCFIHPSYPLVKLVWLRRQDPGAFARSDAWVSFPEYLEHRLFRVRRCSTSMGSGSGLMDVHRLTWHEEALATAGISAAHLSPLVDADEPISGLRPAYAERWPALALVPWYPPLGDGACANAGSGAVGPERTGMTVGTSAAVRALWGPAGPVAVPEDLWCYRLDRRRWVAGGALSNGGNAAAYLRRTLRLSELEEAETLVARMEADAHGLTILPFLRGERGPGWLQEQTATVVGLTESTSPEELLRAWMEAVAYRVVRVANRLEEIVGSTREIRASGGALHASPTWTRILADSLDRPVWLAVEGEDTSRGAALVALENLGLIPDLSMVDPPEAKLFEPRAEAHHRHRAAMRRQQRLLEAATPWLTSTAAPASDREQSTI